MGIAAWGRETGAPAPASPDVAPAGIALVPIVFGFLSLALLAMSLSRHDAPVATDMALAALGVVIVRMALTLRELRRGTDNFRDARTDQLTALQNRRAFLEDAEMKLHDGPGSPNTWVFCWSTSTGSRRSTTLWAITAATSSCASWPRGSNARSPTGARWPGSGATSTPAPAS